MGYAVKSEGEELLPESDLSLRGRHLAVHGDSKPTERRMARKTIGKGALRQHVKIYVHAGSESAPKMQTPHWPGHFHPHAGNPAPSARCR
jgi:hypothetical protein